jgi:hypothetical protein
LVDRTCFEWNFRGRVGAKSPRQKNSKTKPAPPPHPKIRFHLDFIAVLFLAFLWETIEHYLESGAAGKVVADWFFGVEFWANRIVTDPLAVLVGYFLAKKFPRTIWPARILSILWLLIHIFVFPHSMFLHEIW